MYTLRKLLLTYTNMHTYDPAGWFSDTDRNLVYLGVAQFLGQEPSIQRFFVLSRRLGNTTLVQHLI